MFRTVTLASLLTLSIGGSARAQDSGQRLIGSGDTAQLLFPERSRNLAGRGVAAMTGSGDNTRITYGPQVTVGDCLGLVAEMIGSGDDARMVYRPIRPSDSLMARRGVRPGG